METSHGELKRLRCTGRLPSRCCRSIHGTGTVCIFCDNFRSPEIRKYDFNLVGNFRIRYCHWKRVSNASRPRASSYCSVNPVFFNCQYWHCWHSSNFCVSKWPHSVAIFFVNNFYIAGLGDSLIPIAYSVHKVRSMYAIDINMVSFTILAMFARQYRKEGKTLAYQVRLMSRSKPRFIFLADKNGTRVMRHKCPRL